MQSNSQPEEFVGFLLLKASFPSPLILRSLFLCSSVAKMLTTELRFQEHWGAQLKGRCVAFLAVTVLS